jgi:predicted PurR-regulated permease PerM
MATAALVVVVTVAIVTLLALALVTLSLVRRLRGLAQSLAAAQEQLEPHLELLAREAETADAKMGRLMDRSGPDHVPGP